MTASEQASRPEGEHDDFSEGYDVGYADGYNEGFRAGRFSVGVDPDEEVRRA